MKLNRHTTQKKLQTLWSQSPYHSLSNKTQNPNPNPKRDKPNSKDTKEKPETEGIEMILEIGKTENLQGNVKSIRTNDQ